MQQRPTALGTGSWRGERKVKQTWRCVCVVGRLDEVWCEVTCESDILAGLCLAGLYRVVCVVLCGVCTVCVRVYTTERQVKAMCSQYSAASSQHKTCCQFETRKQTNDCHIINHIKTTTTIAVYCQLNIGCRNWKAQWTSEEKKTTIRSDKEKQQIKRSLDLHFSESEEH